MRLVFIALFILAAPLPSLAQVYPVPGADSPRVQTAPLEPGAEIVLTALPLTTVTAILEQGERILNASLSQGSDWDVRISPEGNAFQATPGISAVTATLRVDTDRRSYRFFLETGRSLRAAYVVQLEFGDRSRVSEHAPGSPEPEPIIWSYRLRGDRSVRPLAVRDNGTKTFIDFAPVQPLPAVFAIGPTGEEEVIDGYMRGEQFVVDQVHRELVFRIDRDRATARRNDEPDGEN